MVGPATAVAVHYTCTIKYGFKIMWPLKQKRSGDHIPDPKATHGQLLIKEHSDRMTAEAKISGFSFCPICGEPLRPRAE